MIWTGMLRSFGKSAAVAVGFLTRLPVYPRQGVEESDLGRSVTWFPLVGALLGSVLWLFDWVADGHIPLKVEAVLLVALLAWLTGGLHLDGLADVFDGLSGGHGDRARTLEIMRDSRIGAHGAVALCLMLLLKSAALAEVLHRREVLVLLFPTVSRLALAAMVLAFPYARAEGLGAAFKRYGRWGYLSVGLVVAGLMVAGIGRSALFPAGAALAAALLFGAWISSRLGGLTGDVYGAGAELAEVAFLVAASAG